MAKELASDGIMAADKLKPLLALSKKEPVSAAIALTADGEAVILLDRRAKPKKMMSMLRTSAGKAKVQLNAPTTRFGRAEVDPDYDPAMVRFFVNKDAPGKMRVALIEVVKRCSFQKVEINVDESLEDEPEDESETETPATMGAQAIPPSPPPAPPLPAANEQLLRRTLAELIGLIPGAAGTDPARKAGLLKVAGAANELMKAGDLEKAAATMVRLRQVLGASAPASGAAPLVGESPIKLWQDAKEAVDGRLATLRSKLLEYEDVDFDQIADKGLFGLTSGGQTVGLIKSMMGYNSAPPTDKPAAGAELRGAISRYRSMLDGSDLVDLLDGNPFGVKVDLFATLDRALTQIEAALPPA